jgi:dipeptidyl aminopeptidase/acylaminoacyl peptidase
MGGSAGGYTVLRALSTAPDVFAAGVCMYGISDLFQLARTTHKFELRYLDSLIGPLPEAAELYRARSPLLQPERITRPVAIFQGADDKVVPQAQSEAMVADLRARGVPHEYHVYAGEGHGWRKPETIQHFWETVEDFLRRRLVYGSG